jgi:competence protein ComEA
MTPVFYFFAGKVTVRREYFGCFVVLQSLRNKEGSQGMKNGIQEKLILGLLALLLVGGGFWRAVQHKDPGFDSLQAGFTRQSHGETDPEEIEALMITVHLVGAVAEPGVYHLPAGSRVYELLEMCGGLAGDADSESLNQARPLFDGEQIYVGTIGDQAGNGPAVTPEGGKININRADVSELMSLPGIGEVRAKQIVEYRDNNGLFTDPRELMDVSGIGEKTFTNLVDLITIY